METFTNSNKVNQYWSGNDARRGKQPLRPNTSNAVESGKAYREYLLRFNSSPLIQQRDNRTVTQGTLRTVHNALELEHHYNAVNEVEQRFGVNLVQPPQSCDYDKYLEIVEYLRALLLSQLTPEQGYEEIGYRVVQIYFAGATGQVLKTLAKVIGPQNGAKQFIKLMHKALPWGEHYMEEVRPGYARYHKMLVGGPPPFMLGMIRAAVEAAGARILRSGYTVLSEERDDIIYEIYW
jgi:uncharacterized protein (TIGR02265 family)